MASGFRARPPSFPPGMNLSDYYKVERLIRLAEGRMFYLVNDDRPDRANRRCWECGSEDNAVGDPACGECGASLATRRFLLSSRWDRPGFEPFLGFFNKQIYHPALLSPCDVFPFPEDGPNQICSVVPYNNEFLMLDEAAPLPMERVIGFAQRAIGMLGLLAYNGVRLNWLHRSNFIIRPTGEIVLFDADVAAVTDAPLSGDNTREAIMQLGEILRRYTAIEQRDWQEFFFEAEHGMFATAAEFGRALQLEVHRQRTAPPTRHAGMTDVGLLRMLNEDNWGWCRLSEGVELFVVADGMGGHDCGEVASQLAVETLIRVARERIDVSPRPGVEAAKIILADAFQEANNTIKQNAEARGNDMGTTCVACMVIDDQVALYANVGDSRGYLVRNNTLHQITRDHSLVAEWVERGRISAEEARNHPQSNILLRTVGTERNVEIDVFPVELEAGDRLMLCSDGLWGEVEDAEIESLFNRHEDSRTVCREQIYAAHMGGGKDNISVIVINVPGAADEDAPTDG